MGGRSSSSRVLIIRDLALKIIISIEYDCAELHLLRGVHTAVVGAHPFDHVVGYSVKVFGCFLFLPTLEVVPLNVMGVERFKRSLFSGSKDMVLRGETTSSSHTTALRYFGFLHGELVEQGSEHWKRHNVQVVEGLSRRIRSRCSLAKQPESRSTRPQAHYRSSGPLSWRNSTYH